MVDSWLLLPATCLQYRRVGERSSIENDRGDTGQIRYDIISKRRSAGFQIYPWPVWLHSSLPLAILCGPNLPHTLTTCLEGTMEPNTFVIGVVLAGLLVLLVALWVTDRWTQGQLPSAFCTFLRADNREEPIGLEQQASAAYDAMCQQKPDGRGVPEQAPWVNAKAIELLDTAIARHVGGASLRIKVDRGNAARNHFEVEGRSLPRTWSAAEAPNAHTLSLELTNNGPKTFKAIKTAIGSLNVLSDGHIEIEDCWARTVTLSNTPEFRARRCVIGQLNLHSNDIRLLELRDCVIGRVNSLATQAPAVATISANTELAAEPSRDTDILPQRVQPYRTLRLALKEHRCDEVTEKVIHAAELRLERQEDAQPFRFLSYLFDLSSHYGNRPHRALGFIVVIGFALFIWAAGLRWAEVPSGCAEAVSRYEGWLKVLCEPDASGTAARGAILVAQALTNPFGLFSAKPLVVPETFAAAALLATFSVIAIALLAVAIIGVRRRFKVN